MLEFRRDWIEGFVVDRPALESLDKHWVRLLGDRARRAFKVELSSGSVRSTSQLSEVLNEPNSSSRRIERLEMSYSIPSDQPPIVGEQIEIAFSRRPTDPAIRVRATATSDERLTFLGREAESMLDGYSRPRSAIVKAFVGGSPGEPTSAWFLVFLLPIAIAVLANQRIQSQVRNVTSATSASLAASKDALESMRVFVRYTFDVNELSARGRTIAYVGLGFAIALIALVQYFAPGTTRPSDRHFVVNEYVDVYKNTRIIRSQLFWTVLIGLLVSATGSALIWYLTK